MSTTTINIRVPKEVKESLEYLAKITNVNLSDILRDIVVPIAKVTTTIDAIETINKTEESIVKAIIRMPEFQKLLEKLMKFLESRGRYVGFSGDRWEEYSVLYWRYTIIRQNDMWYPGVTREITDCNSQGYCWTEYITIEPIKTIKELAEFLWEAEQKTNEELQERIKEIKEAIRELLK